MILTWIPYVPPGVMTGGGKSPTGVGVDDTINATGEE